MYVSCVAVGQGWLLHMCMHQAVLVKDVCSTWQLSAQDVMLMELHVCILFRQDLQLVFQGCAGVVWTLLAPHLTCCCASGSLYVSGGGHFARHYHQQRIHLFAGPKAGLSSIIDNSMRHNL